MSERLETLKKARARMIEERNVHAKVLAAPLTGTRPSGHATSSSRFRCWSTRWIAPSVERKSFCRKAEPRRQGGAASTNTWLFGGKGRTVAQCESSDCAERTSWFKPWIPRQEMNAGLAPRPFGRRPGLKGRGDAYAIEAPAREWVARSSGVVDRAASQPQGDLAHQIQL
jgi:hypothetical protein